MTSGLVFKPYVGGKRRWPYVTRDNFFSGYDVVLDGAILFVATKSEKALNRGRFANYNTLPCEHHLQVHISRMQLVYEIIPWLRYETRSWSLVSALGGEAPRMLITVGFADLNDAVLFQLRLDEILSGELKPRKSRKYAATAAHLAKVTNG